MRIFKIYNKKLYLLNPNNKKIKNGRLAIQVKTPVNGS